MQDTLNAINEESIKRNKAIEDMKAAAEARKIELEKARQDAYAEAVVKTLAAVQPGLIEAMQSSTNADMLTTMAKGFAPYALANGESISDTVNNLLRGTTLEDILKKANLKN